MKNEFEALAERCEQASGPDRELDCRVSLLIAGVAHSDADISEMLGVRDEPTGYGRYRPADECVPRYTASLDAAMTLVPEGYGFQVDGFDDAWWSSVSEDEGFNANGKSPALALTAAVLRAHSYSFGDMV